MLGYNEDRHAMGFAQMGPASNKRTVFVASVFDGHGGAECAEFLAERLGVYVEHEYHNVRQGFYPFGGYWRPRSTQGPPSVPTNRVAPKEVPATTTTSATTLNATSATTPNATSATTPNATGATTPNATSATTSTPNVTTDTTPNATTITTSTITPNSGSPGVTTNTSINGTTKANTPNSGTNGAPDGALLEPVSASQLQNAYLAADLDFLAKNTTAGSTCTSAYIYPRDPQQQWWERGVPSRLVVAQVGDSRAILSDVRGNCMRLTAIHRAGAPHESDRLQQFKDRFLTTPGGQQLYMQYANTRSFGDHQAKKFGISAEAEVTQFYLNEQKILPSELAFMLLVTDGCVERASDQELCDVVIQQAVEGGARSTPQHAAEQLVAYSQLLRTNDNATAVVVRLGGWGHWDWQDRSLGVRTLKLKRALMRQEG